MHACAVCAHCLAVCFCIYTFVCVHMYGYVCLCVPVWLCELCVYVCRCRVLWELCPWLYQVLLLSLPPLLQLGLGGLPKPLPILGMGMRTMQGDRNNSFLSLARARAAQTLAQNQCWGGLWRGGVELGAQGDKDLAFCIKASFQESGQLRHSQQGTANPEKVKCGGKR